MDVITLITTSFNSLMVNKLRAILTLLGLIIGVSSVITMMAVGRGAQVAVTQQIQGLGSNFLSITPSLEQLGRRFFFNDNSENPLNMSDYYLLDDQKGTSLLMSYLVIFLKMCILIIHD